MKIAKILGALMISFSLMAISLSGNSVAQEVQVIKGKDRVVYKKRTEINFEESLVESSLLGPQQAAYTVRRGAKFNSLIKYRKNFVPEMWKTARNL